MQAVTHPGVIRDFTCEQSADVGHRLSPVKIDRGGVTATDNDADALSTLSL
jgi:hypothetical protein